MPNAEAAQWLTAIVMAGTMAVAPASPAAAASHVTQPLTATAHAPNARGRATLALGSASKGRLRIVTRGLAPASRFDLVIGAIKVGTLTTDAGGTGRAKLGTRPRAGEGLLGVDPRGQTIAVRDDRGENDLEGDMPADAQDPFAVACCLPEGGGAECDDRTPAACTAAGGTVAPAGSCIPDPCGAAPPGGEDSVVCCVAAGAAGAFSDDDPGIECEGRMTTAECAGAGGTVVQAPSCDPDPCAPASPHEVGACCVPDGGETECELLTPDHCAARHGAPRAAVSCDPSPCGSGGDSPTAGDTGMPRDD